MNGFGYETNPTEATNFLLTPEEVPAQIEVADLRDAKNGSGNSYLYIEAVILEGQQAGRKAIIRHNIHNSNAQTQEWARQAADNMYFALGFGDGISPQGPEDLVGKYMMLVIRQKPKKDGTGNENTFNFKRIQSQQTAQPVHSGYRPPVSNDGNAASAGKSPPWKSKAA